MVELHKLRSNQRWKNAQLLICGDLNIRMSGFSEQDGRLCRPVYREIWMLLIHRDGFNLKPRNPIGVPTHKDGAVLGHCLSHHAMNSSVHVASNRQLLNSDHYPLILAVDQCKLGASEEPLTQKVVWEQHVGWNEATNLTLPLSIVQRIMDWIMRFVLKLIYNSMRQSCLKVILA